MKEKSAIELKISQSRDIFLLCHYSLNNATTITTFQMAGVVSGLSRDLLASDSAYEVRNYIK